MGFMDILGQLSQNMPQVRPPDDPFGSMGMVDVNFGGMESEEDMINRRMRELYQPKYDMQNRFSELAQAYPERENPSGWRKFGAVMAGMGSKDPMGTSDRFLNFHHDRRVEDWEKQVKPIQSAADNERMMNSNDRQYADQVINRDIQNRRLQETTRGATESERLAREKLEADTINKERLFNLKSWMAKNGVQSSHVGKDGNVYVINKDGSTINTGVRSGKLDDMTRLEIGLKNTLTAIDARERSESNLIEQRDEVRDENALSDEALRRTRPPTPRSTSTGSSAMEETRNMTLRGRKAKMHPELGKFVTEGTAGKFDVKNSTYVFGQHISGPTREQRKALLDYMDGKSAEIIVPGSSMPNPSATPKVVAPNAIPSGPVRMRTPAGIKLIPADKVEEAKRRGAVVVQ